LEAEEIQRLKAALDAKMYRQGGKGINQTFFRLRLIVPVALTTGMRIAEIFGLQWSDLLYREELVAVRAQLKGGKIRYTPMPPELAAEFRRYPAVLGEERIFPPQAAAKRERQRVDKSFGTVLGLAGIEGFRFHDLRHTFASWYMMNGGDLYELAKILGHANIKMTERYAKLARSHIAKTGSTAREMWRLMEREEREQAQGRFECSLIVPLTRNPMFLVTTKVFRMWWPGTESNRRRQPFQGWTLPKPSASNQVT